MKRILLSLAAAAALVAPAAAVAGDTPIYGVWVRDGHPTDKLEFYDCAGKLCAKGTQPMLDGSPAPIVLRSAAKTSPNNWKGDLFNPEDGKTYTGKIAYEPPNTFTMTGCLVAFLCQSETWTRVSGPPKPAAAKPEAKADTKADPKADAKADPKADATDADEKPAGKAADAKGEAKSGADKAAAKTAGAADAAKPAKPTKPAADAKAPKAAPAKPKPAESEAN
jgi:uncharacterized protein (DUF2147 family)